MKRVSTYTTKICEGGDHEEKTGLKVEIALANP